MDCRSIKKDNLTFGFKVNTFKFCLLVFVGFFPSLGHLGYLTFSSIRSGINLILHSQGDSGLKGTLCLNKDLGIDETILMFILNEPYRWVSHMFSSL